MRWTTSNSLNKSLEDILWDFQLENRDKKKDWYKVIESIQSNGTQLKDLDATDLDKVRVTLILSLFFNRYFSAYSVQSNFTIK